MKGMQFSRKEKKMLARILIAFAMFAVLFVLDKVFYLGGVFDGPAGWVFPFALYLVVYLFIGYDVLWRAVRNIAHGQVFDENFLMCVATLGAFALAIFRGATGQVIEGFDEACAVLLFYQVGEFFQSYATGKARRSISSLMDIRPDYANVLRGGTIEKTDPSDVKIGETIVVNPGEKIPLDGRVVRGMSALDTKALTGESVPREVGEGQEVISGCINMTARIEVLVEKEFYDSTVSKILELVENAAAQKSKAENFITKFARYYTPTVVIAALLLALIPGFITGDWSEWVYRALSFLVVSCPCALVISVPLSFFAGIGAASRYGILVKGSNYLEKFHRANVFVFDKTGTLTKGNFVVTSVLPAAGVREEEVLRLAAVAEQGASHPIAKSVIARYGKEVEDGYSLTNAAGRGVIAVRDDETVLCGNEKLMAEHGVALPPPSGRASAATTVHVARNGKFMGSLFIADEVKPEAKEVIGALKGMNCRTVMLTGDNEAVAAEVAASLGVNGYKASLLPQDKVAETEKLLAGKKKGDVVCFTGDGINDAPVLMRSDIGIAMGGIGSDAAIEAADIVLMRDDLRGISLAKRIAEKTMSIVLENIVFSIAVKIVILLLSAFGLLGDYGMWVAVFGDVGVAVLAILNAMRVNTNYGETMPGGEKASAHSSVV